MTMIMMMMVIIIIVIICHMFCSIQEHWKMVFNLHAKQELCPISHWRLNMWYNLGDEIKEDERGWACNVHGRGEKFRQSCVPSAWWKTECLKDINLSGSIRQIASCCKNGNETSYSVMRGTVFSWPVVEMWLRSVSNTWSAHARAS